MVDWLQTLDYDKNTENFNKCLTNCGIDAEDSTYIQRISTNSVIFNLKELLRKGIILTLDQFKDTISDIINTNDDFDKLLIPMKTSFGDYIFSKPKSLFQLMLTISELEKFLVDIIIERVGELCQSDSANDNDAAMKCLDQLKWSVNVCHSKYILDRLLDLGYVASNSVKRHIISLLPSVCYGRHNGVIATKLYDWMTCDNNLIGCCLNTINQLDLEDRFRHDIELLILKLLDSAAMHTLPAMITFLMKCGDKANLVILIDKVRSNIFFDSLQTMFSSAVSSTPIKEPVQNCAVQLFNTIKISFQFDAVLQKTWLKAVCGGPEKVRCQSFDLIVLLIIAELTDRGSVVVSAVRAKVCRGLFGPEMVETLFRHHLSLLRPLYKSLLTIGNALMNGGCDQGCVEFVTQVYEQCARDDHDDCTIKDIVDLLLTEITVKAQFAVDNKIAILQSLTAKFTNKVRLFYTEISQLLQLGCKFTNCQIYGIYRIVGTLAFSGDSVAFSEPDDIKQDFTSVVRRQLHNPNLFVRRNGIIGALTVMRLLSNSDMADSWSVGTWARMLSSQAYSDCDIVSVTSDDRSLSANERVVATVLKLLLISTTDIEPQLSIVIFDELYRLISIDEMSLVQMDIRHVISNHLKENYIVAIDGTADTNYHLCHGLLGTDYCDIAVTISQMKADTKSVHVSLPAQFRLLALCEKKTQKNNLKDIDALFGCPLILATNLDQAQFPELITIVNWFIEVVNAFSLDSINDDNGIFHSTFVVRLKEIVTKTDSFERKLADQHKVVKLLPVQITTGPTLIAVTEIKAITAKKRVATGAGNKKKPKKTKLYNEPNEAGAEDLFGDDDDFEMDEMVTSALIETKCKVLKDNLVLCYRELDLSVFAIMKDLVSADLILTKDLSASLSWRDLEFYLNDLWLKTKHRLRSTNIILEGVFSQKNSSLYRYVDRIKLEDFLKQIVEIGPLFKKVMVSCIDICINNDVFDDIDGPCFKVMNVVFKTIGHIIIFLVNNKTESNDNLLTQFMSTLVSNSGGVIDDDINALLHELIAIKDRLPNVIVASSYCTLISNLLKYPTICSDSVPISLRDLSSEFLVNKWSINGDVSLVDLKASVSIIFDLYLSTLIDDWFEVLNDDILSEMVSVAKKDTTDITVELKYGSLNRNTLFVFLKQILDFVTKKCKALSKTAASQRNSLEILQSWEKSINLIRSLTNVVANNDEGHTMFSFIKFSRDLMAMIIKNLMPILDNMLRHENEQVIQLIKCIQEVTRFIQRVCIHCKGKKNLPVTSLVPQVRRHLEVFMYRVKKMMCINKCSGESLNILPLANKDLHGNRIESADEEEEEEGNVEEKEDSVGIESDNETVLDE